MDTPRAPVTGEARLLYRVPKLALVSLLLTRDRQSVEASVQSIIGASNGLSESSLAALTHSDLIRVCQGCTSVTADDLEQLHNDYRYRGMKSLYLYTSGDLPSAISIDIDALNAILSEATGHDRRPNPSSTLTKMRFLDQEEIHGEDRADMLLELPYSYVMAVDIVDPETEYPKLVDDLRRGFVWINSSQGWLAVCAGDEVINELLTQAIERYLGCTASRVYFTKSALRQLEPLETIRRVSLFDASTGTRRRLTNPRMAADARAMEELRARDEHDDRPTSGFNQELPDGTTFALGYSNERGKIFFSRDLTVTQMRAWVPGKVQEIIQAVAEVRGKLPGELVALASATALKGIPKTAREAITELASAMILCRSEGRTEIELPRDALGYIGALGSRVCTDLRIDCELCQEPMEIRCASCQGTVLRLKDESIACSTCGQTVSLDAVECVDGHRNAARSLSDLVYLVPLSNLLRPASGLISASSGQSLRDDEGFSIRGSRLLYQVSATNVVYQLDDIPELAQLLPDTVPAADREAILAALPSFRERCTSMGNDKCAACVSDGTGSRCYLRLFGLLDPTFTPRPHQGHEYGDYSRMVSLDGRKKQLVVAMKTGKPSGRPIRLRSPKGQDISSQVADYRHDGTIDVIGVCVPQQMEDGFRSLMRADVQLAGKGLVFLDEGALCRVVFGAMRRRQLSLDQL